MTRSKDQRLFRGGAKSLRFNAGLLTRNNYHNYYQGHDLPDVKRTFVVELTSAGFCDSRAAQTLLEKNPQKKHRLIYS